MRYLPSVLLMTLVATLNAGCTNEPTWYEASQSELIQSDYRAADELLAQVRSTLTNNQPLIMATIVNIDKLDRSSTLGRLISEQVSARFTQQHYAMTEVKLRSSLYVKQDQGELMLTRELKELAATHDAQAVIVGTYAIGEQFVFVNLKIIQPISNLVMASVDYALPLDSNIRALAGRTQR